MSQNNSNDPTSPVAPRLSKFVVVMRKIYRPLGFSRGYNFPLFVVFGGAMLGFSLARLPYLNISGDANTSFKNSSAPGEWYYYRGGHYRIGITLHLGAVLPAGLLMVWQFLPVVRHKALLFHRVNGYIVIVLIILANVGALMIARRAFGGSLETQAGIGSLVILTTVSVSMAYYNIKRLQIEQHRAWMLRTMFYMGTIITLRLIMVLSALLISKIGGYYQVKTCGQIAFIRKSLDFTNFYSECIDVADSNQAIVPAKFSEQTEQVGAALGVSFGMALWLALLLHMVGVEMYLALTPREAERLRRVSYERQLEAGLENPGSAGLTIDRWGDADPWRPQSMTTPEPGRSK